MSIGTEITRLANAKSAIATAITNKGVTVPSSTKLDGMAALINSIANQAELESITVKTPPTKLDYISGDTFDATGLVLTVLVGEVEIDITSGYTITPETMAADTTSVTISYTAGGKTVSTTQAVTVKSYEPVFANNTWEEIIEAAENGIASQLWAIGDEKPINIDGGYTDSLVIMGFDHYDLSTSDAKYNDSNYNGGKKKAALLLGLKNVLETRYRYDSGEQRWGSSLIRTNLPTDVTAMLPSSLADSLRTVLVKTSYSESNINTTNDTVIVPSVYELFGTNTTYRSKYADQEGTQYAYYAAGNTKIKKMPSTQAATNYYTRSDVYESGGWTHGKVALVSASGLQNGSDAKKYTCGATFVINI